MKPPCELLSTSPTRQPAQSLSMALLQEQKFPDLAIVRDGPIATSYLTCSRQLLDKKQPICTAGQVKKKIEPDTHEGSITNSKKFEIPEGLDTEDVVHCFQYEVAAPRATLPPCHERPFLALEEDSLEPSPSIEPPAAEPPTSTLIHSKGDEDNIVVPSTEANPGVSPQRTVPNPLLARACTPTNPKELYAVGPIQHHGGELSEPNSRPTNKHNKITDLAFSVRDLPPSPRVRRKERISSGPTRPLRDRSADTSTSFQRYQTSSRSSNIGRKRTPHRRPQAISSRSIPPSSVMRMGVDRQTPSYRHAHDLRAIRTDVYQQLCHAEASQANQRFRQWRGLLDWDIATIEGLEVKNEEKSRRIKEQHEKAMIQAKEIESLAKDKDVLQGKVDNLQQTLASNERRWAKLDNKSRKYREFLNTAIKEQQDLFKEAHCKSQKALDEMRQRERDHDDRLKEAAQRAELVRAELMKTVKSVRDEGLKHVQDCRFSKILSVLFV